MDGGRCRLVHLALAAGFADAQVGQTGLPKDGFQVGKVQIDEAGAPQQVGNAAHRPVQDFIGNGKGIGKGYVLIRNLPDVLIGDDEKRIHLLPQSFDPGQSGAHLAGTFPLEGGGNDGDGQHALFPGGIRHHGDRPGACASAHARGEEDGVRILKHPQDIVAILLRRHTADFRLGTGSLAMGKLFADLHPLIGGGSHQRGPIGVDVHIGDAVQPGRAHPAHHIVSRAADADDFHVHHIRHLFIILLSCALNRVSVCYRGM